MRHKSVVVFVSDRSDCLRLICHGKRLAEQHRCALQVISVQSSCKLSTFALEQLQILCNSAQRSGGEMTILFSRDTALTAAVAAKKLCAEHIVSGVPNGTLSFVENVRPLLPEVSWTMVDQNDRAVTFPPLPAGVH